MEDDIVLLNGDDIPGASLDGKDPSELNVVQFKAMAGFPWGSSKWEKAKIDSKVCTPIDSNWL